MNIIDSMFGNGRLYYTLPYPFPPFLIEYSNRAKHLAKKFRESYKKPFSVTPCYEEIMIDGELREITGFYAIDIEFRWSRLTIISA